jgi:signal recognition particle subunit SEC65
MAMSSDGTIEVIGSGGEVEIVQDMRMPAALEAVTRAEIDTQIATAKRYPRSPERFLRDAMTMVAASPELASQCTYALPARRGGDGKPIMGPSVRLAEILATCWGNLRIAGRVVEDDGKMITAQGVAIDLERNVGYSMEVKRRVTTREGRRYSDDMIVTTSNAAIAIVTRNATMKAIPRAYGHLVWEKARAVASGDERTIPERLAAALAWFAARGAPEPMVFRSLGVIGRADVTLDHLLILQGYRQAILDGEVTAEEIFDPKPEATGVLGKGVDAVAEKLAALQPVPPPVADVAKESKPEAVEKAATDKPKK